MLDPRALAAIATCLLMTVPAMGGEAKQAGPAKVYVKMATSMGDIYLELDREKAPITVENFLRYAREGFYDGTIFHRVIENFMIQGGGLDKNMKKKPTHEPIKNEWRNGLKNRRGTIAMARLGRQPDSATAQFFINVRNNGALDVPRDGAGYAVFGKVIKGMDVVDKIKGVRTTTRAGRQDVPVEPVEILSVKEISRDEVPSG